MLSGEEQAPPPSDSPMNLAVNPTIGTFKTSDGRWINFTMLQPGRYFADVCRHLGLEHLIDDERFNTAEKLMANALEAGTYVAEAIAAKPYSYWIEHLKTMEGQWAPIQSPLEILADPQMEANGYILPVTDLEGNERKLVANPVQFDETPARHSRRAPQFAEHTDDILRELGRSEGRDHPAEDRRSGDLRRSLVARRGTEGSTFGRHDRAAIVIIALSGLKLSQPGRGEDLLGAP